MLGGMLFLPWCLNRAAVATLALALAITATTSATASSTPLSMPAPTPTSTPHLTLPPAKYATVTFAKGEACHSTNRKTPRFLAHGNLLSLHGRSLAHCQKSCLARPGCTYVSYDKAAQYCLGTTVCEITKKYEGHNFEIFHMKPKKTTILVEYTPFIPGTSRRLVADRHDDGSVEEAGGHEGVKRDEAAFRTKGYCDAPKKDVLYAGPAPSEQGCINKCTLVPACAFISFSEHNDCKLVSTCHRTKMDRKGIEWISFRKKAKGSGSILIFARLGLIWLLGCLMVWTLTFCCRQMPKYTELSTMLQFAPVAFKNFDSHMKPEGHQEVRKAAQVFCQRPHGDFAIKIIGYTGKPGGKYNTDELCKTLSFERATRVMHLLEKEGCKHLIVPIGYGNVREKGSICEILACTYEEAYSTREDARKQSQFLPA